MATASRHGVAILKNHDAGVRPSQLIASVLRTLGWMKMPLIIELLMLGLANAASADQPIDPALHARVQDMAAESLRFYRLPELRDLTGDWAAEPEAWCARADFDGDGVNDVALLLVRREGEGFQLLMLLGPPAKSRAIVLEEKPWAAQGFGLAVARPGRYKTAVGKGYWVEAHGDPDELTLKLPALDRYHFESWNAFWYWDSSAKQFRYVQMSDSIAAPQNNAMKLPRGGWRRGGAS